MLTVLLLATLVVLLVSIYFKFKSDYNFWKNKNVPFFAPEFSFGNICEFLKESTYLALSMEEIYKKMKHVGDYCGIFISQEPYLLVLSPEFTKTVLSTDFEFFMDHGVYSNEKSDPLDGNLYFLEGQRWKDLRAKLTPTFTPKKLKEMFLTVLEIGNRFVDHLQPFADNSQDIEILDLLARLGTDIFSSLIFGIESNSLKNPVSEFRTMGKRVFTFGIWRSLKAVFSAKFSKLAVFLKIQINDKDVSDFFLRIVQETVDYRRQKGCQRKDFMQLLIDLMNKDDSDADKLTFNEVAAQAYIFYSAGFESTSNVTCFAFHTLAHHPEIQEKARQSVFEVLKRHNNEWSYEAIADMTYIEQIMEEMMRMYSPDANHYRIVTKDYKLPNGSTIEKGVKVIVPVQAFQRDPDIFPEPMKFDPERFTPEAELSRHPFASLPFGKGPRYCIGMRFGILQVKLSIALLLANFKFSPCNRTDNPIKISPNSIVNGPEENVWLNVSKVD